MSATKTKASRNPIDHSFDQARQMMVEGQLRTNKIIDPALIAAMRTVPREAFLPKNLKPLAYVDMDLKLGDGRTLLEPMVLAWLLQAAAINRHDRVLEIGFGCGYCLGVLAQLADHVVGLESRLQWLNHSQAALDGLAIKNAKLVKGELLIPSRESLGAKSGFDVIVIAAAVETVSEPIFALLNKGGRLVTIKAETNQGSQLRRTLPQGMIYRLVEPSKKGRHALISSEPLFTADKPLLAEFNQTPQFHF